MDHQSQPTGAESGSTKTWRVGQLAELSGVTVRTLRYYDQAQLLLPSGQTSGGHRVYDQDNVTRLYRILALRRLGFGLDEIRSLLDDPQEDLQVMVARHIAETERMATATTRLAAHLRVINGELFAGDHTIWLHPTGEGYRSPRQLGAVSSMTVIAVDDADDHHAHATEHGAEIVEAPISQPYGVREYGARDLEGHLWFFHSPLG